MNRYEKKDYLEAQKVILRYRLQRRVYEIRFDCIVTMHDVGFKKQKDMWGQEKQSKTPQWFKANHTLTLEEIKYADPHELGMRIKEVFNQLEKTIEQYEQPR